MRAEIGSDVYRYPPARSSTGYRNRAIDVNASEGNLRRGCDASPVRLQGVRFCGLRQRSTPGLAWDQRKSAVAKHGSLRCSASAVTDRHHLCCCARPRPTALEDGSHEDKSAHGAFAASPRRLSAIQDVVELRHNIGEPAMPTRTASSPAMVSRLPDEAEILAPVPHQPSACRVLARFTDRKLQPSFKKVSPGPCLGHAINTQS